MASAFSVCAGPAVAEPPVEIPTASAAEQGDANRVTELNAGIKAKIDQIDAENAKVVVLQEQYKKDRAAYEEAMRANAREVAAANAARQAHEAEMAAYEARWHGAGAVQPAAPVSAKMSPIAPAPTRVAASEDANRRICTMQPVTGSLVLKARTCVTVKEAVQNREAAQKSLRDVTSGLTACGQISCN